jgi:signal transduction histidine kinase
LRANFPVEIAPLARETNALIDANREIVERARTHVGNLAHALKTPLSVIVNEASTRGNDPFAQRCWSRPTSCAIRWRASSSARGSPRAHRHRHADRRAAGRRPRCARTMEKLHRERGIAIEVDAAAQARFRGEQQDLEEMIGNLVDNACKWAQSRVASKSIGRHGGRRRDRR